MSLMGRAYNGLMNALPPAIAGRADFVRPSNLVGWGGPLNGQERRREIVRELARSIAFTRVVETGTYRGSSAEFFLAVFGLPVDTVEGNPRFFKYSLYRLRAYPSITVHLGDSRAFLRGLDRRFSEETVFVYLDAHWADDLPLREELEIVAKAWPRVAVLIDDFAVPGDDGYTYDDYGLGKALVEDYLPVGVLQGWSLRYPAAASSTETGEKRGSCVLLSPALGDVVLSSLTISRVL